MRVPAPRHCPSDRDCRTWAVVPHPDSADPADHQRVHNEVEDAWRAVAKWLAALDEALGDAPGLSSLWLPHPEPGRAPVNVGLVDADLSHAVIAAVQKAGEEVDGLYLGVVAQEPTARWIGLAGSFLPICSACNRGGVAQATDRLIELLVRSRFDEIASAQVPVGLRPRPGWFERDRLQTVASRPSAARRSAWQLWPLANSLAPEAEVLVRVGPVVTDLNGLVLCRSSREAQSLPGLLGADPTYWTWTAGPPASLNHVARHQPRRPREVLSPRGAQPYWWTSDRFVAGKEPGQLHRGPLPRPTSRASGSDTIRFWGLAGDGVVTSAELDELAHTPASF